jgi:hypothetical protein
VTTHDSGATLIADKIGSRPDGINRRAGNLPGSSYAALIMTAPVLVIPAVPGVFACRWQAGKGWSSFPGLAARAGGAV